MGLSELQHCRCARDLSPFHSGQGSYLGEIMGLLIAEREQFYWEQQSRTRGRLGEESTPTLLAYNVLAIPPPSPHLSAFLLLVMWAIFTFLSSPPWLIFFSWPQIRSSFSPAFKHLLFLSFFPWEALMIHLSLETSAVSFPSHLFLLFFSFSLSLLFYSKL